MLAHLSASRTDALKKQETFAKSIWQRSKFLPVASTPFVDHVDDGVVAGMPADFAKAIPMVSL